MYTNTLYTYIYSITYIVYRDTYLMKIKKTNTHYQSVDLSFPNGSFSLDP